MGYDVLSCDPVTEKLHFIEVKGRAFGADTVTVSKNQILTALNKPDAFILALVKVWPDDSTELRYLETPFKGDEAALFDVTSVTFDFAALWEKGAVPAPPEHPPIEHWIELMTERIVAQFSPERIVLFGSHARGDAHGDPDVDLLVIFDEVESQHELGVQIRTAVADVHVPKDIVVRSTEEVRRRGNLVGTVLKPALEDGRVLYARS
jgi:predicted nucleotidyltransferase